VVAERQDGAKKGLAERSASHGRDGGPFERGYLAFVWGAPDRPRGTIDRPIDRHKVARDRMAIREGGRDAVTHWEVLERYGGQKGGTRRSEGGPPGLAIASLLACRLATRPPPPIPGPFAPLRPPLTGAPAFPPG